MNLFAFGADFLQIKFSVDGKMFSEFIFLKTVINSWESSFGNWKHELVRVSVLKRDLLLSDILIFAHFK